MISKGAWALDSRSEQAAMQNFMHLISLCFSILVWFCRLLEYVAIGPRFSNLISQTLLVLLKRVPPKVCIIAQHYPWSPYLVIISPLACFHLTCSPLHILQGKNLLVVGTTSEVGFLESVGMCDVFSVTYHVPKLKKEDAKKVRNIILDFVSR